MASPCDRSKSTSFRIALLLGFVLVFCSLNANAATCDNLYIVVPPKNNGISDGGVFYLYEDLGAGNKFQTKGYLPVGTLVWNQPNPIDLSNNWGRNIDDDATEDDWHLYFISEFGEFGYIRETFLKKIVNYVTEEGLEFDCSKDFGVVVPFSAKDDVIIYKLNKNHPPSLMTSFSRSAPLVVTTKRGQYTNNFLNVKFFQKLNNGQKRLVTGYLDQEDEGKTYRLAWVQEPSEPITADYVFSRETIIPFGEFFIRYCHKEILSYGGFELLNYLIKTIFGAPPSSDVSVSNPFNYIRKLVQKINNMSHDSVYLYRMINCAEVVNHYVDHFLSLLYLSIEVDGQRRAIQYPDSNKFNQKLQYIPENFQRIKVPSGRNEFNKDIPLVGMIAFKSDEKDYFSRYKQIYDDISEKVDSYLFLEEPSRSRLIYFLVNTIIYANSKNDH